MLKYKGAVSIVLHKWEESDNFGKTKIEKSAGPADWAGVAAGGGWRRGGLSAARHGSFGSAGDGGYRRGDGRHGNGPPAGGKRSD